MESDWDVDLRIRDTIADAKKRKRERKSAHRDKAYLGYVASKQCCACGYHQVEVHHEPPKSHAGEWHDRLTVPLCAACHRGGNGRHLLGKTGFEEAHGINLDTVILILQRNYKGE